MVNQFYLWKVQVSTPIFNGKDNGKDILLWEHEGNCSVRRDDWKLVCRFPGDWELYNLNDERTEINNLADKHPEMVQELDSIYQDWAERCFIYPWDKLQEHRRQRRQQR